MVNITVGLLLLSPLFFMRSLLYPFVLGKATLIQIFIALMLPFLGMILYFYRKSFFKRDQILTWSVLVYAGALLLTTITGVSSWQSFWGTSDRSFGVFTVLHILSAYFVFLIALKDESSRRRLMFLALIIGVAAGLMGIFEYLSSSNGTRITGAFGNPILFGGYLLFPLFFSLILIFRNLRDNFWTRMIYVAIFSVILFALLFAQSRGALFGAVFGGLAAAAIFVMTSSGNKKIFILKILAIIGIVTTLIFILERGGNNIAISLVRRFFQISLKDASTDQRLRLYGVAFEAFKDKPWLGWGPENFDYAFDRNYDPSMLKYGVSETWVDRSHNNYLDTLVTNGVLGVAAYVFMFIAAGLVLYKRIRIKTSDKNEDALLFALLTAYGVYIFFAFDSQASMVYFVFFLAYLGAPLVNYGNEKLELKNRGSIVLAILLLPLSLSSLIFTLKNVTAAGHMLKFSYLAPGAIEERLNEIKSALKIKPPLIRDFRLRVANKVFEDAVTMNKDDAEIFLSLAIDEMEKNVKEAPEDFSYRFALGNLYLERGMLINANYLDKAEEVFNSAEPLSPNRQSLFFQWASVEYLKKDFDKAIFLLKRTVAFDPSIGQPHWRLGIGYAYNEEVPKAIGEWRTALWKGYEPEIIYFKANTGAGDVKIDNINFAPDIKNEREFVLNISLRERDFDIFRVLTILSIGSVTGEAKGGLYAKLAVAELETGNFSDAREALRRAVEYDPSAQAEAEIFLRDIYSREQAAAAKK